jgi:EpsD family peptidyl-prolyl cis-trans isomerase
MPQIKAFVLAVLVTVLLVGCNRDRGPAESQIAARVNKGEVSVHQLQAVLQRQPRLLASSGEAAAGRVLEVLVEQELAAQAAESRGLDADPGVIQTLAVLRREALARAFQDSVAAKVTSPTSDEIDRYYESRPALFAQRRLYLLQETAVEVNEPQTARLRPLVAAARNADDVGKLLRDANVPHSSRLITHAAEDLPQLVLEAVAKVDIGQSVLLPQPGGARIYTVVQAFKAPVDRRTANAAITNYLVAERKRQAVGDAMKSLREAAKVEYLGAFVPRPGVAASPANAAPAVTQ